MGPDYFVFYAEASIVCIIILMMLLLNDKIYRAQHEKQVWFSRVIIAFILYFICDMGWAAVVGGRLPKVRSLVVAFNLLNFILLMHCAYEWFVYVTVSEKMSFRNFKRARFYFKLPMLVCICIMVGVYFANPYFWIDKNNDLNSVYYIAFIAMPVVYLLVAFFLSVHNIRKTNSKEEKWLYWLIGFFPLGILVSGLVQVLRLNAPIFCCGCTIMVLFFYIHHLQTMISVDDLTRLNNRRQINRFMEQIQYRENNRVFAMMIDVDRFKEINDNFGHAEGDRALTLVSDALKRVCERMKAQVFLGRYGGDEFTVILQNPEENELPEDLIAFVRAELAEKKKKHNLL